MGKGKGVHKRQTKMRNCLTTFNRQAGVHPSPEKPASIMHHNGDLRQMP